MKQKTISKNKTEIYYKGNLVICSTASAKSKAREIRALEYFISKTKNEVLQRIAGVKINQLAKDIYVAEWEKWLIK